MELASRLFELLWIGALAAIPLALLATAACRLGRCRPATRHAIWTALLASFVLPLLTAALWRPVWIEAGQAVRSMKDVSQRGIESFEGVRWGLGIANRFFSNPMAAPSGTDLAIPAVVARAGSESSLPRVGVDPVPSFLATTQNPVKERTTARSPFTADHTATRTAEADAGQFVSEISLGTGASGAGSLANTARPLTSWDATAPRSTLPCLSADASISEPNREIVVANRLVPPAVPKVVPAEANALPGSLAVASSPGRSSAWGRAMRWLTALPSVRTAMSELPPLTVSIWTGGTVAVVVVSMWRTVRLRRIVARGTKPSLSTLDLVEDCAERIGLSRVPETVMVAEQVSPLVWCGGTPRLVLPGTLWAELDPAAKRAVIMHELAHLRRLDHRLCWLVGVVGALYWWHPIAWWAQRRLRDEADLCCDAWVTTLLPGSRRAYAEVLLATKVFLSEAASGGGGVGRGTPGSRGVAGLSMVSGMSGRSKRMARRLTMVMKERVAPRASVTGVLAAIGIAAAGTFVTPGLACPPEKDGQHARSEARAGRPTVVVVGGSKQKRAAERDAQAAANSADEAATFFGEAPALEAMRGGSRQSAAETLSTATGHGDDSLAGLEDRIRELESRMKRLHERAADVRGGAAERSVSAGGAPATVGSTAPRSASARNSAGVRSPLRALAVRPMPLLAPMPSPEYPAGVTPPVAPVAPVAPVPPVAAAAPSFPRSFGALAPMTAPAEGTIPRSYSLPTGKLKALIALMERQDVPIFIERQSDSIVVHATEEQHEAFNAFIKLIHPEQGAETGPVGLSGMGGPEEADPAVVVVPRASQEQVEAYRRSIEKLQRAREKIERRMEESRRRSEAVRERSVQLAEISDQLDIGAQAQALEAKRAEMTARAAELRAKADATEAEADALEAQSDALESELDNISDAFEEVESQIGELESGDAAVASDSESTGTLSPSVEPADSPEDASEVEISN